jgi:hypothetical protein
MSPNSNNLTTVGSVATIFKDPLPSLETSLSNWTPDCVIIPSRLSTGNLFNSITSWEGLEQPTKTKNKTAHKHNTKFLIAMILFLFTV